MLFLTDVDHVSFEKVKGARQNNLQSATVSLQVVIGLCKRKETAALKIKVAVSYAHENLSLIHIYRKVKSSTLYATGNKIIRFKDWIRNHYE